MGVICFCTLAEVLDKRSIRESKGSSVEVSHVGINIAAGQAKCTKVLDRSFSIIPDSIES